MNYSGVIFDMDGVIFDTEAVWRDGFYEANEKFGTDISEEFRIGMCGKTDEVIRKELKEAFPELPVAEYREYTAGYVDNKIKNGEFGIKPGFEELVLYLKSKNIKTAIATSSPKMRAYNIFSVKNLDITEYFDACVFGDETGGRCKPDPYIFLKAAEKIKVAPENCIVLEDSLNGITAAVRGGFMPVMVVDLIEPDGFCKLHCSRILRSLREAMKL